MPYFSFLFFLGGGGGGSGGGVKSNGNISHRFHLQHAEFKRTSNINLNNYYEYV